MSAEVDLGDGLHPHIRTAIQMKKDGASAGEISNFYRKQLRQPLHDENCDMMTTPGDSLAGILEKPCNCGAENRA